MIETLATKVATAVLGTATSVVSRHMTLGPGAGFAPTPIFQKIRVKKPATISSADITKLARYIDSRLRHVLDVEYRGIPASEKEAAILAAIESFEKSTADIWECTLNPDEYSRMVLKDATRLRVNAGLSEQGEALYGLILREISTYIVQYVTTWPTFSARVDVEQLRQIRQVFETVTKIYELMGPDLRMADLEFEEKYCSLIAQQLDRLEIFGVDLVDRRNSSYNLTTAYITLSVADAGEEHRVHPSRKHPDPKKPIENGAEEPVSPQSSTLGMRTETALSSRGRILLRGDAGSGKTTLLRWLSVNTARRSLPGELSEWNTLVPFILPLRRFANSTLPTPPGFLSEVGSHLAGEMPSGWVNRLLRSGRALVLIDGVDELPADQRDAAREWLDNLVATYPTARYLVTSRPAAAETDWLTGQVFTSLDLLPMTGSDVENFVQHWHNAARNNETDEEEMAKLNQGEVDLISSVKQELQLRRLASNPLLCALLCTLNRDRHSQLPKDRMELYKAALEMLLLRRDRERKINYPEPSNISDGQKKSILGNFAYWLMRNGLTDSSELQAVEQVRLSLQSMPAVSSPPKMVFDYLMVRSGCLRRPVEGRVDFVHRTFQEYLAAARIVELDDLGVLLSNAHLDQWHEVVVMAIGHARPTERSRLISGLLDRGDNEAEHRSRLHILAAACLETAGEFDPQVYQRVKEAAAQLIPPRKISDAKALAAAGEMVIPLIPESWMGVHETAATVRMAATLGGDAGLSLIARFATDERKKVRGELERAWLSFDPEEYAIRVISKKPEAWKRISIGSASYLPALKYATRLKDLEIWCDIDSLDSIPGCETISWLHARRRIRDFSYSALRRFGELRNLSIAPNTLEGAQDLEGLKNLTSLRISYIEERDHGTNTLAIPKIDALTNLSIFGPMKVDLLNIGMRAPNLKTLSIHVLALENMDALRELSQLESVSINNPPRSITGDDAWSVNVAISALENSRISSLYISASDERVDIRPLLELKNLGIRITSEADKVPIGWDDERVSEKSSTAHENLHYRSGLINPDD